MSCMKLKHGNNIVLSLMAMLSFFLFPRKVILSGATQSPHPFGIAVFENHVFFTDWSKMAVIRADRFDGSDPTLLYLTANKPGQVEILHSVLQPVGKEMHIQLVTGQFECSDQRCLGVFVRMISHSCEFCVSFFGFPLHLFSL